MRDVSAFNHGVITTAARTSLGMVRAGIGSRALAYLVDWFILLLVWMLVAFVLAYTQQFLALFQNVEGSVVDQAVLLMWLALFYFGNWMYFVVFETAWHGQTPGKRYTGLRVTTDQGLPVGFYHAVMRTTLRIIDFLPLFYAAGLTSALCSRQGKRLGDFVAGTILVRERTSSLFIGEPPLCPEASLRPVNPAVRRLAAGMSDDQYETLRLFLTRRFGMTKEARRGVARELVAYLSGSPSGQAEVAAYDALSHPEAFLEDLWRGLGSTGRQ